MFDIIEDKPKLIELCKKRGVTPLILGKDVLLVESKKEVKQAQALLVLGTTGERELVEEPIDGITAIEETKKKDHYHFRRGLTQVEATILKDNTRAYIINYSFLRNHKQPEIILGRMLQNTNVCKGPVIFASFASKQKDMPKPDDLHAFFRGVGFSDKKVAASQKEFSALIKRAKTRASSSYVAEGVTRQPKGI